jgi:hypothetical protein
MCVCCACRRRISLLRLPLGQRTAFVEKRYSNFVNFPIVLGGERVNTVQALWAMSKGSVTQDQCV